MMKNQSGKAADNKTFGIRLKELRRERGLTQAQLAEKARVSRSSVANWESGIRFPDIDALKLIATLFNVPTDYLYGLSDYRYRVKIPNYFELDLTLLNDEGLRLISQYYQSLLKKYPSNKKNEDKTLDIS